MSTTFCCFELGNNTRNKRGTGRIKTERNSIRNENSVALGSNVTLSTHGNMRYGSERR